jgi:hypothetical protein
VIYGMRYVASDQYRYVGLSVQLKQRMHAHASNARSGRVEPLYEWLRNMGGLHRVAVDVLEEGPFSGLEAAERAWIAKLRAEGHPLLNVTVGGFGGQTGTVYDERWWAAYRAGMARRGVAS